jgi:hypothetical protein
MGRRLARIACASFEPPVEDISATEPPEPKTLDDCRIELLRDKSTTFKKEGTPLDPGTIRSRGTERFCRSSSQICSLSSRNSSAAQKAMTQLAANKGMVRSVLQV